MHKKRSIKFQYLWKINPYTTLIVYWNYELNLENSNAGSIIIDQTYTTSGKELDGSDNVKQRWANWIQLGYKVSLWPTQNSFVLVNIYFDSIGIRFGLTECEPEIQAYFPEKLNRWKNNQSESQTQNWQHFLSRCHTKKDTNQVFPL